MTGTAKAPTGRVDNASLMGTNRRDALKALRSSSYKNRTQSANENFDHTSRSLEFRIALDGNRHNRLRRHTDGANWHRTTREHTETDQTTQVPCCVRHELTAMDSLSVARIVTHSDRNRSRIVKSKKRGRKQNRRRRSSHAREYPEVRCSSESVDTKT